MTERARLVREAADYMAEHLNEKLTIDTVAGHIYMSKSNLGRLLKAVLYITDTLYAACKDLEGRLWEAISWWKWRETIFY